MTSQLRSWLGVVTVIVLAVAGSSWWAYQTTRPAAVVTTPPVSLTVSPLSSPVIDQLKHRSINGNIPVTDPGDSGRLDPFVQ